MVEGRIAWEARMMNLDNVNDHEREDVLQARITELEEALQEARLQLEYLSEKFGQTGTGNTVLARINMALAGSATYESELAPT